MTQYRDEVDAVAHNFNNTTLTVDGTFNIEGLEMVSAERIDDEVTIQKVASGMAIAVENPSKVGEFKFQMLESSPSTKDMWDLRGKRRGFKVSMTDTACPNFNSEARYCRVSKPPALVRKDEVDVVEWTLVVPYLEMEGDSYRLEAE